MPVITAIETQKTHAERVNVYLDGQFAFGASALVVAARHLRPGLELSTAEVEALKEDDSVERAYNAALNYLSFRPRSAHEIQQYFRRKGIEIEVAQAVIERLQRVGLLNDDDFARFWIDNRQSFRPRGARALRVELRQKGVSTETIDLALENLGDEEEIALSAARKKVASWQAHDDEVFIAKLIGFLQRRGFPYGVARKVARRLLSERSGEASSELLISEFEEISSE